MSSMMPTALFAAIVWSGCHSMTPTASPIPGEERQPMLLFAIDGLEWKVLLPLLEQGRLPAIAGLMERGSYGQLESLHPTYSPVIWTSIATGKTKEEHGIEHFVYLERGPNGDEPRYYTSGHRKAKAFWNILSDYHLTVHSLGWWITYPVEPINGIMVSQTNTTAVLRNPQKAMWKGTLLKGVEGQVHPTAYQNHIMSMLDQVERSLDENTEEIFGEFPFPTTEFSQHLWDQTRWSFRADAVYLQAALEIVKEGNPFDLMAVYIGGPDASGHRFWRYAYPEEFRYAPDPEQVANFGGVIDDYYAFVDESLGEIIAAAPKNTTVMIVSDHGMHGFNQDRSVVSGDLPTGSISGHHLDAPPGVFIAAGPQIRNTRLDSSNGDEVSVDSLPVVGGVLDVLSTLLALKALPIGTDLDGQPMTKLIASEWLDEHPISTIPTHDDSAWHDARRERMKEAIDQNDRLEQLRSLGYIE